MDIIINTKQLRASLPDIVRRTRRGERFLVLYRSRPAFKVIPVGQEQTGLVSLDADSLYQAEAVGRSSDGLSASEHDSVLYRSRR